jgi:1,4-dihydroxy-2-naphthoate polyprenyltransferase
VFVFVFFGLIAVMGTAYLQSDTWSITALAAAIPAGLLVTNILVINNLRDLPTDRTSGKLTLAVRLGERGTRAQYALFTALAYLVPTVMGFSGPQSRRWILLPLATAPLAVVLVRRIHGGLSGRELNPMLQRTGQLLLSFGLLFAAGLVLARTL